MKPNWNFRTKMGAICLMALLTTSFNAQLMAQENKDLQADQPAEEKVYKNEFGIDLLPMFVVLSNNNLTETSWKLYYKRRVKNGEFRFKVYQAGDAQYKDGHILSENIVGEDCPGIIAYRSIFYTNGYIENGSRQPTYRLGANIGYGHNILKRGNMRLVAGVEANAYKSKTYTLFYQETCELRDFGSGMRKVQTNKLLDVLTNNQTKIGATVFLTPEFFIGNRFTFSFDCGVGANYHQANTRYKRTTDEVVDYEIEQLEMSFLPFLRGIELGLRF